MHVVIYEDRPTHWIGAKLTVLSLREHVEDAEVHVHLPGAPDRLRGWFDALPNVHTLTCPQTPARKWDVKPSLLLQALRQVPVAHWLDSDVLVCADPAPVLDIHGPEVLVATEETPWGQQQGGTHRTQAWGLAVGRSLPVTVNTGFLRVSRAHTDLLSHWAELLEDEHYRRAQQGPWRLCPLHLLGDQEVLTALLGSGGHADVPLHLLVAGTDIAQCFGPSGHRPRDRLRGALRPRRPLSFVHAMGRKPWEIQRPRGRDAARPRDWYDWWHQRLSPYRALASRYAGQLGEPTPWLGPGCGLGRAQLQELPLAVIDGAVRAMKARCRLDRFDVVTSPLPAGGA